MSWPSRADRIHHDSPEHGYVWRQIADDLIADVESGALPPGAKLPGGQELADIYGVAKMTAARAVRALKDEGVVTVLFGRGTFVARK